MDWGLAKPLARSAEDAGGEAPRGRMPTRQCLVPRREDLARLPETERVDWRRLRDEVKRQSRAASEQGTVRFRLPDPYVGKKAPRP
jgi:hypothetical protein